MWRSWFLTFQHPKCPSDRRAPRRRHPPGPPHVGPTRRYPQGLTRPNRGGQRRSHRDLRHLPPTRPPRGPGDRARPRGAPQPHPGKRRPGQGRYTPCRLDAASARGTRPKRPPPPATAGRHPGRTRGSRQAPPRAPPLRVAPAARRPRVAAPPAGPPPGLAVTAGRSRRELSGIADQRRFPLGGAAACWAHADWGRGGTAAGRGPPPRAPPS